MTIGVPSFPTLRPSMLCHGFPASRSGGGRSIQVIDADSVIVGNFLRATLRTDMCGPVGEDSAEIVHERVLTILGSLDPFTISLPHKPPANCTCPFSTTGHLPVSYETAERPHLFIRSGQPFIAESKYVCWPRGCRRCIFHHLGLSQRDRCGAPFGYIPTRSTSSTKTSSRQPSGSEEEGIIDRNSVVVDVVESSRGRTVGINSFAWKSARGYQSRISEGSGCFR